MVAVLLVRSPFLSLYLPLWFPSTSHYISIFPLICQSYPIQIYQNEILILATNSIGISINVLLVYPDGGFFWAPRYLHILHLIEEIPRGIPDLYSLLILALLAKLPGPPAPAPPAARAFRQRPRAQQGGSGWLGAWEHLVNLCFFFTTSLDGCFFVASKWEYHGIMGFMTMMLMDPLAKLANITNYDLW